MIQPGYRVFLLLMVFFLKASINNGQIVGRWDDTVPAIDGEDTLALAWAGGLNSAQYNTIDLNEDEQDDLLLFDRTSNTLLPFLRENGEWVFAPEYASLFPANLQSWVLLKDFNGDGAPDLFTASGSRGITVYQNNGQVNNQLSWTLVDETLRTIAYASGAEVTLQVNSSDYPAITDVDQDGDLDVITYSVIGSGELILHQNQSVEQYGHPDSLVYKTVSIRWGEVEECNCGLFAFKGQTCDELSGRGRILSSEKVQHVGGKSLLVFDADGDQDIDVLSGDEGCFGIAFLENEPVNDQATFQKLYNGYPDNTNPSSSIFFPGAYLADADGDKQVDLLLSPNASSNVGNNIDFRNSSWWYKNVGTTQNPQWQWETSAFLQAGMIDVGEEAVPALADYDADGDLDLFIGSRGSLRADGYYAGLYLYENIGNAQQPVFRYKTDDFLQLSEWKVQELKPYFVDINQDGRQDLLITGREAVSRESRLYALLNQASNASQPYSFRTDQRQVIELSFRSEDNLAFYDIDQDQQIDVLVGKQSGNLVYYRNQSETFPPRWNQEDESFAGINRDVRGLYLAPTVTDINQDGKPEILSTDVSGNMLLRSDFEDLANDTGIVVDTVMAYSPLLASTIPLQLGRRSWLTVGRINGDSELTVIVGSPRGGISLLRINEREVSGEELSLRVFPNPASSIAMLRASRLIHSVQVINLAGQVVHAQVLSEPLIQTDIEVAYLPTGLYIVRTLLDQGLTVSSKLLIYR